MHEVMEGVGWTLGRWQRAQRDGRGRQRLEALRLALDADDPAWISLADAATLDAQWEALTSLAAGGAELPLYGVPFAVKDNIDALGWPTTAACPEFAYAAEADATVVARLRAAGAILIGKTNLDQFATGLVGTRSPFGAVPNSVDARYVSGGSSSGSASVVARGLVPFALGTDTAGSGRVPAGFNNIVGLKPTKGWLSTAGVVPACRSLDCVSIFALTVEDALLVAELAGGGSRDALDPRDAYARTNPHAAPAAMPRRPRLGVPASLEFHGDRRMAAAFREALATLGELAELVAIDYSPFAELAELLYRGPWVAERTHAVGELLRASPEALDPTVREIVGQGRDYDAVAAFDAEYRRMALAGRIQETLAGLDALVVPTSPTLRTLAEMAEEPIRYNSEFGTYTNFTNLADLCALALPAPWRGDGLPAGITLIAPAWHDRALAEFGRRWQARCALPLGATGLPLASAVAPEAGAAGEPPAGWVRVAVVGAHLTGMPLNVQLTSRRAVFVEATSTAAEYRLHALAGSVPPKPGLVRDAARGASIEVELWDVPLARFGEFVAEVPAPLGIGTLRLADGREVKGFICEPWALPDATDITEFRGWRAYLAAMETRRAAGEAVI